MIGLTKTAARELASRGIRVNAIAPGFIETDMTEVLSDKVKEASVSQIPLGHFGKPEDVGKPGCISGIRSGSLHHRTGDSLRRRHGDLRKGELE